MSQALSNAGAATMCSYQIWQDTATTLPPRSPRCTRTAPLSPYAVAGQNPQTWPLNESHFSCEQPLTLTYALRNLWGSVAMVGSDYPATHSTSAIFQGEAQEQPTTSGYFSDSNTLSATSGGGFFGPPSDFDATGDTCADADGNPGRVRPTGDPRGRYSRTRLPVTGCTLVPAVPTTWCPCRWSTRRWPGPLPGERFGMLDCYQPGRGELTNPGG